MTTPPRNGPRAHSLFFTACSILLLSICGGCAHYHREPLNPAAIEQQLRHYELADLASEMSRLRPGEAPHDLKDGLGPDEAGLAALILNPALKAKRIELGIASGQLLQAGLYPNPTFDNKSLLGSQKPVGNKDIEASLSVEVLRWEEWAANKQTKTANCQVVHYEILSEEWKAVTDARAAYWAVVAAREKLRLNKDELELSSRLGSSVEAKIKHGVGTAFDTNMTALQNLKLLMDKQKLEADADVALNTLKQAIGLPYDAELKLRVPEKPLSRAPRQLNLAEMMASLPGSATLKALEWRYEISEGELRGAIARQYPSLKLGPSGTFTFDGHVWSSLYGFVGTVDVPLFNRNQGEIKEKCAARELAKAEYASRLQQAQAALAAAFIQVQTVEKRLQFQETEYLPKAQASIELSQKAFTAGDIAGSDLLTAHTLIIDVDRSHLDLQIEYRQALEALEAALGRRIEDVPAQEARR